MQLSPQHITTQLCSQNDEYPRKRGRFQDTLLNLVCSMALSHSRLWCDSQYWLRNLVLLQAITGPPLHHTDRRPTEIKPGLQTEHVPCVTAQNSHFPPLRASQHHLASPHRFGKRSSLANPFFAKKFSSWKMLLQVGSTGMGSKHTQVRMLTEGVNFPGKRNYTFPNNPVSTRK